MATCTGPAGIITDAAAGIVDAGAASRFAAQRAAAPAALQRDSSFLSS